MIVPKIRIAVLLGGASNEKEISLESGRNVSYKLSSQKYETTVLFVDKELQLFAIPAKLLVRNTTREIQDALTPDMKMLWNDLPTLFDFVFIALHGGAGENGSIQGTLEMLKVPYNGSGVLTSALCMDKFKTNEFLKNKGFIIPEHWLIAQQDFETTLSALNVTFPLIVKPHDDGCSMMVHKVHSPQELLAACKTIFTCNKTHALVEEYVQGMELTVGVIGNDSALALPPSQTIATRGILSIEEKFLPGAGENQTPAALPQPVLDRVRAVIAQVYQAVGCKGYARIDCFYQAAEQSPTKSERVVILEINTLPGLTPATCIFHQAAEIGMRPAEFIDMIVQLGFEQHTQQGRLTVEQKRFLSPSL